MRPVRTANRGFTLVEMMVSLALGLLLAIVVAQLFASTRDSNRAAEDGARLQESLRFAADVIGRTVRIAGYKSHPTALTASVFPAVARAIDATNDDGTASGGFATDTLTVRFQGAGNAALAADNTVLDCLGVPIAPDFAGTTKAYNKFSVAPGADGRNALFCSTDPAVNPGTELVPGIEAMQVLLGEDTTGDGTADRFLPPAAPVDFDKVVVARVYLLISGKENVLLGSGPGVTPTKTYTLAGVGHTYTDRKLRRVVTTTLALRNRVP